MEVLPDVVVGHVVGNGLGPEGKTPVAALLRRLAPTVVNLHYYPLPIKAMLPTRIVLRLFLAFNGAKLVPLPQKLIKGNRSYYSHGTDLHSKLT